MLLLTVLTKFVATYVLYIKSMEFLHFTAQNGHIDVVETSNYEHTSMLMNRSVSVRGSQSTIYYCTLLYS